MTRLKNVPPISSPKKLVSSLVLAVCVLFVVWMQITPMAGSGLLDRQGNLLFDRGATFYDAGVHLSLISEIEQRFPPTNFALGGIPLRNYHYLYDASLAVVAKLLPISVFDLYFRFAPIVVSLLLCLGIYSTIWRLTKNVWASTLGIFFTVFATSLGSVTGFFRFFVPGHGSSSANNLFMTDQIYDWMVNPHGVFALVIFLFLFLCLSYYSQTKKIKFLLFFSVVLGLSFGIKAYGGIVFAAGTILAAIGFARDKNHWAALTTILGLALMAVWVLLTTDHSVIGLKFAPLWFLDRMMADFEHLYDTDFLLWAQIYSSTNNFLHLFLLYFQAFVIYLVGSLGLRILGLGLLIPVIKKPGVLLELSPEILFFIGTGTASFTIPFLFNQSTKPFDIVQFIPYFTLLTGIALTIFIFQTIKPLRPHLQIASVTMLMLISIFLVRNELWQRFHPYSSDGPLTYSGGLYQKGDKIAVSGQLLSAVKELQKVSQPDNIILLAPTDINVHYLWFTAIAARRTVFSGEFLNLQIGASYKPVEEKVHRAFEGQPTMIDFDFLFLQNSEREYFAKIAQHYQLRQVFGNDAAAVYQRI